MSTRETLEAALTATWSERVLDHEQVILAAARERLAQMPEKCGTCYGRALSFDGPTTAHTGEKVFYPCPSCHGSGRVYPAELVERIAGVILQSDAKDLRTHPSVEWYRTLAVAVLDAINQETL